MKVPYSWLKDHVDLRISPKRLTECLTMAGLEVESMIDHDGDPILEINVTPNRGDCLSVIGVAREISALTGQTLKKPAPKTRQKPAKPEKTQDFPLQVTVKNSRLVPRYMAQVIADVKIGPSPSWLVRRLEMVGLRSVNNVVDATNYVLFEYGQPLHAFDYDQLTSHALVTRPAKRDEVLKILDGGSHKLLNHDIVIADTKKAVALGGIMGGGNSEVTAKTRHLVVESASFDPSTVRKTSKRLGVSSESSYRFERGVDIEGVKKALERVSLLICELTGGRLIRQPYDIYPKKGKPVDIIFAPAQVNTLMGTSWTEVSMKKSLKNLGFKVRPQSKARWKVTAPTYRPDVNREVDLIEEVARVQGFETIPTTEPREMTPRESRSELREFELRNQVQDMLAANGFFEAIHFSFCSRQDLETLNPQWLETAVPIQNPLAEEQGCLRPSLLPSLLRTAAHHQNRQIESLRLFELRPTFIKSDKGFRETMKLGGVLSGLRPSSHWETGRTAVDFYDVKGAVEKVAQLLTIPNRTWQSIKPTQHSFLHPGKSCVLYSGDQELGYLGALHPGTMEGFGLKQEVYLFELHWPALMKARKDDKKFAEISKFPYILRDLALLADERVSGDQIEQAIRQVGSDLVQDVSVFDLYRGKSIDAGKKSLGYSLKFGSSARTLTEEEVNQVYDSIVNKLNQELQITIR
jgi:phenylalanyl-tRNA synthetase beta chain